MIFIVYVIIKILFILFFNIHLKALLSILWGLGIGDWGLGILPHTPNPKPQTPNPEKQKKN